MIYGQPVITGQYANLSATLDPVRGFSSLTAGLEGLGGNDYLVGANDDDVHELLIGGDGSDDIRGFAGDDTIHGNGGTDYVDGGEGDDMVYGEGALDIMSGGRGLDQMWAGEGDDVVCGDLVGPAFDGPADADVFNFSSATPSTWAYTDCDPTTGYWANVLRGGNGGDWLEGGLGDEFFFGEGGDDDIFGGSGFDQILGGYGEDYLHGEADLDWICDPGVDSSGVGTRDLVMAEGGGGVIYIGSGSSFAGDIFGDTGVDECFPGPTYCPYCINYTCDVGMSYTSCPITATP